MPGPRYAYLWEFEVAPGRLDEFLIAYGPAGSWSKLFSQAEGYIETLLLQDQANPNRFLTIDRWKSPQAHDAFRARFQAEYAALDLACEALTQHEGSLGSYWDISAPEI